MRRRSRIASISEAAIEKDGLFWSSEVNATKKMMVRNASEWNSPGCSQYRFLKLCARDMMENGIVQFGREGFEGHDGNSISLVRRLIYIKLDYRFRSKPEDTPCSCQPRSGGGGLTEVLVG